MNNEIRDLILSVFNLRYLGEIQPKERAMECDLNCDGFYFIQSKKSLVVGRNVLGSNTTFLFSNVKLTPTNLTCNITVTLGDRKTTHNNVLLQINARYSVKDMLYAFLKSITKSLIYDATSHINDLEEFQVALEGKLDKELFDFVEEVKQSFPKLEYRNTNPTELTSYTPGIPTISFSRNIHGELVLSISSFANTKPQLLVGEMATISNIRICIKNEFGIFKKERMRYHEQELDRTQNWIDYIDAQ